MRTRKSKVTFQRSFILNRDVGELPAGTYDIEIDEEELQGSERTGYRQVAIYFYVQTSASTRTLIVSPSDLEFAVQKDSEPVAGPPDANQSLRLRRRPLGDTFAPTVANTRLSARFNGLPVSNSRLAVGTAVKLYRINKLTRPGGSVVKKKDVLAASDKEAIQRAAESPDCPICDVLRDGESVGSVT